MSPQEVLATATGDVVSDETLAFGSVETARVFAVLVLMHLGLSPDDAEDAVRGRFKRTEREARRPA